MTKDQIRLVLIQTVGTGGPKNPVWEALAFTVQDRRPDVLVQWCSKETYEKTVPRFEESLGHSNLPGEVRRSVCDDPNDVDSLVRDYLREIDALRAEYPNALIELDFTSGTKPMSAAAVAAAVARRVPRLHYAVGPRDETGRVIRTEKLVSFDTDQMVADPLLCELGRLFNEGQHSAVRSQAGSLVKELTDPLLRARAESLAYLAEVYEHWDRFAWNEAFCLLREYRKRDRATGCLHEAGWDLDRLADQVAHLKRCKAPHVYPARLADLLANAQRRIGQGRHDDAAARLYRLTEYIAQVRFRKQFGIKELNNPTGNVSLEQIAPYAPQLAAYLSSHKKPENGRISLGVRYTIAALAEAKDSVGQLMQERYNPSKNAPFTSEKGRLGYLLDQRNQSLLAHGTVPVTEKMATAFYEELQLILAKHMEAEHLILNEVLRPAEFLPCPWVQ